MFHAVKANGEYIGLRKALPKGAFAVQSAPPGSGNYRFDVVAKKWSIWRLWADSAGFYIGGAFASPVDGAIECDSALPVAGADFCYIDGVWCEGRLWAGDGDVVPVESYVAVEGKVVCDQPPRPGPSLRREFSIDGEGVGRWLILGHYADPETRIYSGEWDVVAAEVEGFVLAPCAPESADMKLARSGGAWSAPIRFWIDAGGKILGSSNSAIDGSVAGIDERPPSGLSVRVKGQDGFLDGEWVEPVDHARATLLERLAFRFSAFRVAIVRGADPVKLAEYNDKAAWAEAVAAGLSAPQSIIDEADSEAVRKGLSSGREAAAVWAARADVLRERRTSLAEVVEAISAEVAAAKDARALDKVGAAALVKIDALFAKYAVDAS